MMESLNKDYSKTLKLRGWIPTVSITNQHLNKANKEVLLNQEKLKHIRWGSSRG